jgi:hypothetical protein
MHFKGKNNAVSQSERQAHEENKDNAVEYPDYPAGDDIYNRCLKENDLNPEDTSKNKESGPKRRSGRNNEKDFNDDMSGGDLDVPGSEPDDNYGYSGGEDEENDYFSLGGDDHSNLDEDGDLY